jgi:glutamate racemase
MWLGTTPLCSAIPRERFRTPANTETPDFQNIQAVTQEIIWRTKAVYGSDYSTADTAMMAAGDMTSEAALKSKVKELVRLLGAQGETSVLLGCTELPQAFKTMSREEIDEIVPGFTFEDPAESVAASYKKLLEAKKAEV